MPGKVIEWVPHNNLENIEYITKGGCSEIYTAKWIGGSYNEWDSEEQQLIREYVYQYVILKGLGNIEDANQRWFEEVCSFKKKKVKQVVKIILIYIHIFFIG